MVFVALDLNQLSQTIKNKRMKKSQIIVKWWFILMPALLISCGEKPDPAPRHTLEAVADASPKEVEVGKTVQLKSADSKDEGKIGYTVSWTFAAKPTNSNATIQFPTSAGSATFVPDVAGTYELLLTIENTEKEARSTDKVSITATNPAVIVLSNTIAQDLVLENINPDPTQADYRVTKIIDVGAKLTIKPGVVLVFEEHAGFSVNDLGILIADGTQEQKIVFRGASPVQGYWAGIRSRSTNASTSISNAEIHFAGSMSMGNQLQKAALSLEFAKMKLQNVVISNSGQYGIQTREGETSLTMQNVTFENNAGSHMYLHPAQVQSIDADSDFKEGLVEVYKGDIATTGSAVNWVKPKNGKYFISGDLAIARQVNIAAGSVFEVGNDVLITVADHATAALTAKGTADNPITFSGRTKQAGTWKGIMIISSNENNLLEHVTIENGGSAKQSSRIDPTNIGLDRGGKLTLRNAHIANSAGHGIIIKESANSVLTSSGVTFANNPLGDVKKE
jgi:hypothetical protein